jgi:Class III cytochrome C family/Cytochrome c7 and related cytochrome c
MKSYKKISITLFTLAFLSLPAFAQDHSQLKFNCSLCHACETPTKSNPCLIACPREKMMTVYISPAKSPAVIKMDKLKSVQDLYEPVVFSHRIHAEMSEMSGGCEMCHHYNPPGDVVGCDNCHEPVRQRTDISKPDLKGAYHRQCIDCHREWNSKVACESCHELNESGKSAFTGKDYEKERVHPEMKVPSKLVFNTTYEKGKIVTFFHNEHTGIYGLDCKSCHQEESCAKCHSDEPKQKVEKVSLELKHKTCSGCHDTKVKTGCESCHSSKEMAPFNHLARTGFNLKSYHSKLSCTSCHQTKTVFTGLNSSCNSCHSGWNSATFKHQVTGLLLDETHFEFDCSDCHSNEDYSQKPSCEGCHDDMSYPEFKPGKLVK